MYFLSLDGKMFIICQLFHLPHFTLHHQTGICKPLIGRNLERLNYWIDSSHAKRTRGIFPFIQGSWNGFILGPSNNIRFNLLRKEKKKKISFSDSRPMLFFYSVPWREITHPHFCECDTQNYLTSLWHLTNHVYDLNYFTYVITWITCTIWTIRWHYMLYKFTWHITDLSILVLLLILWYNTHQ